jgi:transposase InsO family protein
VQYVSIRYTERLAEAGIERSVGSLGDSYDNALAETSSPRGCSGPLATCHRPSSKQRITR